MKVLIQILFCLSLFTHLKADDTNTIEKLINTNQNIIFLIEPINDQIQKAKQKVLEFYGYKESKLLAMNILDINMSSETKIQLEKQTKENIILSILFFFSFIIIILISFYIQKRKTQQKLEVMNERYQLALENSNAGIWDWDIQSNNIFITQKLKEMFAISNSCDTIHYNDWVKLLHPEDKTKVLDSLHKHLKNKSDFYIERFRAKGVNGTWRYIKFIGKAYFNVKKKPIRILGFHMDETEKIRLKNKNKLHEVFLQAVSDAQPNITITSYGDRIHKANQAFLDFFNIDTLEHFTKDYPCICDKFIEKDGYLSKFMDGQLWLEYIYANPQEDHKAIIKKDNELYIFIVKAQKLKFDKKNRFIVVLIDITKLIQQKEIIVKQEKRALMGDMIENIAHQWRQPLSVITVIASGMKARQDIETLTKEDISIYCENIEENIQYLNDTIDDFKNFYKDEKTLFSFSLKNIIEKVIKLYSSKFYKQDIQLIQNIDDIEITGFKSELIQVFMNIFSNAKDILETIKTKRLFFITVVYNKDFVNISFKDNAGGIPTDIIDKVFDPYFSTKIDKGGTGIGLYMTKQIIEQHFNGKITVENIAYEYNDVKYNGAQFNITIPIKKEKEKL